MAINDPYVEVQVVEPGDEIILEGASAETGAAELHEIMSSGQADLYRAFDLDDSGEMEEETSIDQFDTGFHKQDNALLVSETQSVGIKMVNTSETSSVMGGIGIEVDDGGDV